MHKMGLKRSASDLEHSLDVDITGSDQQALCLCLNVPKVLVYFKIHSFFHIKAESDDDKFDLICGHAYI